VIPPRPADPPPADWYAAAADALLNRAEVVVAGAAFRVAEVEFYVRSAAHPDPFAHAHPVQRNWGRWYFHRTGAAHRGGSFKGLDLTLGDPDAAVGVLLRTVVAPDGAVIDGPSRLVDTLLSLTAAATVAGLDARLGDAFDPTADVWLREAAGRGADVFTTARVGLSLKRAAAVPAMPRYVGRPYRFLTEPRRIGPGRPQLVCALHAAGADPKTIRTISGIAPAVIARYTAAFDAGRFDRDFARFVGVELSAVERCRLLGAWDAAFGGS
jgi:hypothetical protein